MLQKELISGFCKEAAHPATGAAIGAGVGALGGALAARRGQKQERTFDSLMRATGAMDKETHKKRGRGRALKTLGGAAVGGALGAGAGHGAQLAAPHIKKKLEEGVAAQIKPHLDAAQKDIEGRIGEVAQKATHEAVRGIPKGLEHGSADAAATSAGRAGKHLKAGLEKIKEHGGKVKEKVDEKGKQLADAAMHEPSWQPKFMKGKSIFHLPKK